MEIAFVHYLTSDEIIKIHKNQIRLYGGISSSVDMRLLEISLFKVTETLDNKELHYHLIEIASLYLFHLIKDRPFPDGNKRTAVASALKFLSLNQIQFEGSKEKLRSLTISIAEGNCNQKEVISFFEGLCHGSIA